MKLTHNLIDKMHHDLVWWKNLGEKQNEDFQDENDEWEKKGLDHKSLDAQNQIKNHWRHVRTRLYFTSASHLYTLLNVIKHGLNQIEQVSDKRLEDTLRLDFMSGIFFRVFENLYSDDNDPARFKLEIMINNGSLLNPDKLKDIENHCIPISLDDTYSKTLTLDDIDTFFMNMQSV